MKNKMIATVMLLTTAIIWGLAFVAQVLGGDALPSLTFNGARFVLGGLSLIPVYLIFEKQLPEESRLIRRKRQGKTLLSALIVGLFLFAASALQQIGIQMLRDPGKSSFITGLYTVLTPIFAWLLFKRKTGWNTWVGVLLAMVGLYLLCLRKGSVPSLGAGEWILLVGAFFWAGHILAIDRLAGDVPPLRFCSWQFLICGAINWLFAAFTERPTLEGFRAATGAILFCGLLSTGVAYTLQVLGQRRSDPTYAAILFSTESVFATLGGLLWNLVTPAHLHMDQEIRPIGYVGALIIFTGILLSQLHIPAHSLKKKRHT